MYEHTQTLSLIISCSFAQTAIFFPTLHTYINTPSHVMLQYVNIRVGLVGTFSHGHIYVFGHVRLQNNDQDMLCEVRLQTFKYIA